ncbi:opacity protein-like surface antigen [Filimonas zeae]|uniref:Outer membrane protein beta-barrel domain-containing protein n=1 Tax=Filimonas zeae TaxID=1737353 RepID=A0A917MZU5_9BACT|nr:outer membrane beta-barrel protein [Filimonas zeae]MDR6342855.1 opacity protein-like surface antigen [Filimonas zeae]GGH82966.1 hypothetical protein GCM10011379_57650 [Filimonas zeae]
MTDKLFDDFIQDKLRDHSSKIPEGLWTRIEEELRPEKEDKKIVLLFRRWYSAAAILVLALAGATWFYVSTSGKNTRLTDKPVTAVDATVADKTPGTVSVQPGATTAQAYPNSQNAGSSVATTTGVSRNKKTKAAPTPDANTQDNVEAATGSNNAATATTPPLRSGSGKKIRPLQSPGSISDNATAAAQGNGITNAQNPVSNNVLQSGTTVTNQAAFVTLPSETAAIPAAQKANYAMLLRQYIQSRDNSFFPIIRCPPVRNTVPSDLFIEAYASPDKVFRQSSANYGSDGYTAKRDTMLSLRTSFTAGVRLSKALTENLLLKAGLQYSQINENFHYRLENERKTVTVVTTHTISNSPGDTIVVRDTTTYEQIGYIEKRVKNRYRSIDIPVLLSYEWGNSQWRFAVNAGPVINLRSWYSGELPDTSSIVNGVKGTSEVFRKNIGLGAYAGVSIIKTINENMDLFAEPWLRYNFSDMTQNGQAFNQKFTTTGLSLGIRYRLNGGQRY